jgi:hypothetical protein
MRSAFKTFASATGIVAACYLINTVSWIQLLLLCLAGSLGWCVYSTLSYREVGTHVDEPLSSPTYETMPPGRRVQPVESVSPSRVVADTEDICKFPIHKLGSRALALAEPSN